MDKNRRAKTQSYGDVEAEDARTDAMEMAREQRMAVGRTVGTDVFNSQTEMP